MLESSESLIRIARTMRERGRRMAREADCPESRGYHHGEAVTYDIVLGWLEEWLPFIERCARDEATIACERGREHIPLEWT